MWLELLFKWTRKFNSCIETVSEFNKQCVMYVQNMKKNLEKVDRKSKEKISSGIKANNITTLEI